MLVAWQYADAAQQSANLIANGNAETLNANGELANWSVYVRRGKATLTQTTEDKAEGTAAARLEIPREGAVFDVRTGLSTLKPQPTDATYLLTASVKSESAIGIDLGGYFCIGAGSELKTGKLPGNEGWQDIRVKIKVPANERITRLEFSGGSPGRAVILIDNVRLQLSEEDVEEVIPPHPLETAIKIQPGVPTLIKKVMPTDCKLVRGFYSAPIDGRTDTRYATGPVIEWSGMYGSAAINYRAFNGNNGLHIELPEEPFNAMQIRGGWRGRMFADIDTLLPPDETVEPVCKINPQTDVYCRVFESGFAARKLSFFYYEEHRKTIADLTVLQFDHNKTYEHANDSISFGIGAQTQLHQRQIDAFQLRYGEGHEAYQLAANADEQVVLNKGQLVHLIAPPQSPSDGVGAVTFRLNISEIEPDSVLTLRVQDVLDARREVMAVDVQVPGPGQYVVTLDAPDQVVLPAESDWQTAPRLKGEIAPPPSVCVSIAANTSARLKGVAVTLHRVPRDVAIVEAGDWRKMLLKGLFSTMSEPRPWMHVNNKSPVREQLETSKPIERYRPSLYELLENAEIARLILPADEFVVKYHQWLYQNIDRRKPQPPAVFPQIAGAPKWAIAVRENYLEQRDIAQWWLDNRMVPNGELGGYAGDDTDMFQVWQCLPMIESDPLGAQLKDAAHRLSDLAWNTMLVEGMNRRTLDSLHAYEEGINQLALCAWWFYGDPVHYERVLISSRSVLKLLVETEDGRLHFGSNYVGLEEMRNGFTSIGATPGGFGWAPVRFLWHPVYVAALYNRNPALIRKFEQWGKTWADYQKPGDFVEKVDIKTGKPIRVTSLPASANVGPVDEWLALYHVTGDPKWHNIFKMGLDHGGYSGTAVQYGRMPHALVEWESPYDQIMRDRFAKPGTGYAGFFLAKDRSILDSWLDRSASWFQRYRHMHTAAEQKTDRILTYNASAALSCYLGDAPNRNRWLNFTAVSYEKLRGQDFAALVWDAGKDKLRVAIYNFNEQPLEGIIRVWRLDHGNYRVRVGPDHDDDGNMDSAAEDRTMPLQRYSPITLKLPPKQVTILKIEQLEQLDEITSRADLAISPLDATLDSNGKLSVNVHNIGSVSAGNVQVHLSRGGQKLATRTIDRIAAPNDLVPKKVLLHFENCQAGDTVIIDPDDTIAEIAEHNNIYKVP